MPATLFVDRQRRIEEKSGLLSEAWREWEIRFMVTAAGTVADISGLSSDDGPVPDALAASVLTSQLDALLFITDYPLERKGKPVVAVTSVAENEKGFVEIAYTLRDEGGLEQLPVGAEGAVMTARGSASYSAADRFFTRRTHEATTSMHIMQAATGDEKTVTMTEKTAYEATIKSM
jgi:hypothetical protein